MRRIFDEYPAGRTSRAIAIDLNREHVPAPRGDSGVPRPLLATANVAPVYCRTRFVMAASSGTK